MGELSANSDRKTPQNSNHLELREGELGTRSVCPGATCSSRFNPIFNLCFVCVFKELNDKTIQCQGERKRHIIFSPVKKWHSRTSNKKKQNKIFSFQGCLTFLDSNLSANQWTNKSEVACPPLSIRALMNVQQIRLRAEYFCPTLLGICTETKAS